MEIQIVTSYDIELAQKKIGSDEFFNPAESEEQINNLYDRFSNANLVLQEYVDLIFAGHAFFMKRQSPAYLQLLQRQEEADERAHRLIEQTKFTEILNHEDLIKNIAELQQELVEISKLLDDAVNESSSLLTRTRQKLDSIMRNVQLASERFKERMLRLNARNRNNKTGLYVVSFLLSTILALLLDYSGIAQFSNIVVTILQVLLVFIVTELMINRLLKSLTRSVHRPDLSEAISFLNEEMRRYEEVVQEICKAFNIDRGNLFFELAKMHDDLKLNNPTTPVKN